jgi:ribosomal protein L37AE/L43A
MSDQEARATFQHIRWADNGGEPYCPRCGCLQVKALATRPVWKCGGCRHQFSITSGTIFDNRKRPVRDYLLAIAIFVNGAKGVSALQLSRDLNCQYKTAFVLAHKLREAMQAGQCTGKVSGTVEVDGAYFGGHTKPKNKASERVDRRLAEEQTGKRRVVVVIRQRDGRTLPFVTRKESEGTPLVRQHVAPGSTIHADEASGWDSLYAHFDMRRVNHSVEYKSAAGACTNQAESYFSRLRRMEIGTHHHISGRYLASYAGEAAYREDHRQVPNGALYLLTAKAALLHPASASWRGYWQRKAA